MFICRFVVVLEITTLCRPYFHRCLGQKKRKEKKKRRRKENELSYAFRALLVLHCFFFCRLACVLSIFRRYFCFRLPSRVVVRLGSLIVPFCPGDPDYKLKCIGFWKENLRSYLVTYDELDAFSKYRCWVTFTFASYSCCVAYHNIVLWNKCIELFRVRIILLQQRLRDELIISHEIRAV